MDRSVHRYSRFVATLKVLLPLAALVLLSTLFLLARVPESGLVGRIAGDLSADGRMYASTFTAMTEDGPLTVSADAAIPRAADYAIVDLEGLSAELDVRDERIINLTAQKGRLARPDREATFEGDVRIETSDGIVIESDLLRSSFDASWAESPGAIRIQGPDYTLDAGRMSMEDGDNRGAGARVLFNEGVRLIYVPQPDPEKSDPPQ